MLVIEPACSSETSMVGHVIMSVHSWTLHQASPAYHCTSGGIAGSAPCGAVEAQLDVESGAVAIAYAVAWLL